MLYEKNYITEIKEENGKRGIYASFPCEEDNTYDYLLLEDINNIVFMPESIQSYKNAKLDKCNISFITKYDESDPYNIKLIANVNDICGQGVTMELQTIVDKLCLSAYEFVDLDNYQEIHDLKMNAINEVIFKLFIEEGILISHKYNFMGRIIDKQNNIVGIIDSFDINIDNENILTINLNNVVSYFNLKDIDVKAIEFPTGRYTLKIDEFEIVQSEENILREYILKSKIFYSEYNNQELIGIGNQPINDPETFFDDKSKLLTKKEELFLQNNVNEMMSELFDDFEL